ncbi:transposase, partial [Patescibacteria group bacterium AH-259-L07]|nr:transposase [Patescibacteria group bacterium AH-259-L07]
MRKVNFVNNQFYHVYNRGVEKRDIFMNEKDYIRFIHDLFEFNNTEYAHKFLENTKIGSSTPEYSPEYCLVNMICFCLMPNHYHLILEQLIDSGIPRFMHKLSTGYTNSFNLKYDRVGSLFQGRYKAIHIDKENYLLHLSRYIHLNPIELIERNWKEEGIKNWKKVNDFLEDYRWSSYLDYIGKKNFPSVINKELI